jgi:hypothetical protein
MNKKIRFLKKIIDLEIHIIRTIKHTELEYYHIKN